MNLTLSEALKTGFVVTSPILFILCYRRRADITKMVKEYRRPTVGKDENNPADVRPPCILRQTVNYLIDRYKFNPRLFQSVR